MRCKLAGPRHFASSTIKVAELEIPVKLFSVLSEERGVSLRKVHKGCGRGLEQIFRCPAHGLIEEEDQAKGYEIAPGRYLELTDAEIEELYGKKDSEIAISRAIDPRWLAQETIEKSYFLGPHEAGDRGYALLARVLNKGLAAFGRSVVRGREHLAAIASDQNRLVMRQIAHASRLRPIDDVPGPQSTLRQEEIRLGRMLFEERLWDDQFAIGEYKDAVVERVEAMLKDRALGKAIPISPKAEAKVGSPVLDLGEALQRSLALSRKSLQR